MMRQLDGQLSMFDPDLQFGKTCPGHSPATREKTSGPCSKPLRKSDATKFQYLCLKKANGQKPDASWEMAGALPGVHTMLNFGECPSDARGSTLSQILEANVPDKYFLSRESCEVRLRRAEQRGKELPKIFKEALLQMIDRETASPHGSVKQDDAMELMGFSQRFPAEGGADKTNRLWFSQSKETP